MTEFGQAWVGREEVGHEDDHLCYLEKRFHGALKDKGSEVRTTIESDHTGGWWSQRTRRAFRVEFTAEEVLQNRLIESR